MTDRDTNLLIWGASGHARVVAETVDLLDGLRIVGFVDNLDPGRRGEAFMGATVLGGEEAALEQLARGADHVFLAFGNCAARLALDERLSSRGVRFPTIVHPRAVVSPSAVVGPGTLVVAGAVVNAGTSLGRQVIVNTSSSVDHECTLAEGVHVAPGAHLAANVRVGRGTWVGLGALVKEKVTIGSGSIIGAGAVVVDDLPDNVVAYGVPARIVRSNNQETTR